MFLGVVFAICACFIWGFIFVVPQFMGGFSSIEIALGRYLLYGVVSLIIFCKSKVRRACHYSKLIWITAVYFSLILTIIYYTFVVLSLRYSAPAICTLVLGLSPITIAFYGNWKQKEIAFRRLIIPSVLILVGLVVVNIPHFERAASSSSYILGVVCSFVSLAAWSWYVVANSWFLKRHPEVKSSDWATLVGVATLFWVLIFTFFLALFFENQLCTEKYLTWSLELKRFLLGSLILGLVCSWIGGSLWNKASLYLPVSLAGQLMIFETVFGVIFVYVLEQQTPSLKEIIGIAILLIAIVYGVRQFPRRKSYNNQLAPD